MTKSSIKNCRWTDNYTFHLQLSICSHSLITSTLLLGWQFWWNSGIIPQSPEFKKAEHWNSSGFPIKRWTVTSCDKIRVPKQTSGKSSCHQSRQNIQSQRMEISREHVDCCVAVVLTIVKSARHSSVVVTSACRLCSWCCCCCAGLKLIVVCHPSFLFFFLLISRCRHHWRTRGSCHTPASHPCSWWHAASSVSAWTLSESD